MKSKIFQVSLFFLTLLAAEYRALSAETLNKIDAVVASFKIDMDNDGTADEVAVRRFGTRTEGDDIAEVAKKVIEVKDGKTGRVVFSSHSFKSEGSAAGQEEYREDGFLECLSDGKMKGPKLIYHSTYGGGAALVSFGQRHAWIFGWDGEKIAQLYEFDEAQWNNRQAGVSPFNQEWIVGNVNEWVAVPAFKDVDKDGWEDITLTKKTYSRDSLMPNAKSAKAQIKMFEPDQNAKFLKKTAAAGQALWNPRNRVYE